MEPAKKAKVWMETAGVKLPIEIIKQVQALGEKEGKTKSAMLKFLIEIGLEVYSKGGAKDLAILRGKLKEIRGIVER